jgi:hypothetical protein
VQRHFEVIETVLAALTEERESLMQERRNLLGEWKRQAAVELNLLRDLRALRLALTADTSTRMESE